MLVCVLLVHHFGLWAWTTHSRGLALLDVLNRWDSALYTHIITEGYVTPLWAFLPLYPGAVWGLWKATGGALPVQVVGCVFSSVLLLTFVAWAASRRWSEDSPLVPRTRWGWFVLLYSPASYALHSHHTEGLFLLLSFGALALAWERRVAPAALLAGLCVLTRNQGVFVVLAAALLLLERPAPWKERLRGGLVVGLAGVLAYAALLLFEWKASGDVLAHVHAQASWSRVETVGEMVRSLWFGNRVRLTPWLALRPAFAALGVLGAVLLWRRSRALTLYGLLSIAVMLPQGDLGNALRFGAVVFPGLFALGDGLARRPVWLRAVAVLLWVVLNHKVTHAYGIGTWAY